MPIFHLKRRDTRPILEVALTNPDGSPFDHAGSSAYKLHIWLSDGSKLVRDLVPFGAAPPGGEPDTRPLRYTWVSTDWDPVSGGGTVGGLVVGPTVPLQPDDVEHRMEYEVVGGSSRITFPNDGYDVLRILDDIGQG